jgi:membrane-anchored protein YejM (alkaline phosphatase superfamily)
MIDVKLIRIVTGEEIIAEVLSETDDSITVQNGLVVLPNAQGVGFAPWATVISKDEPEITMKKTFVVYVASVQDDVAQKYNEMFGSKLVTPSPKKLIV